DFEGGLYVRNHGDYFRARERQVGVADRQKLVPECEEPLTVDLRHGPVGAHVIVARQELDGNHVARMEQGRVAHFRRKMTATRDTLYRLKSDFSQLRGKMDH